MMLMEELHQPVLLSEVLDGLAPRPGEAYLDLTAGYAGHAGKILDVTRNYKETTLVDRDAYAADYLRGKYSGEPVEIVNQDFYNAVLQLIEREKTYDMILADFGVSSPQLDQAERGFAFSKVGPLDMRMDRTQKLDAEQIVNQWNERKLVEIFVKFGEEKPGLARKVASKIIHGRPWQTTKELAEGIAAGLPYRKVHPATKIFQAIRIAVNDELGEIERTLPLLPKLLRPGGRVAIITFHSLEDRLVKRYFKEMNNYGEESELIIVNKSPIIAEKSELVINPRARSAKLRIATKR